VSMILRRISESLSGSRETDSEPSPVGRRVLFAVLIALVCLGLAFVAQHALDRNLRKPLQYGTLAVAAALFALAFGDVALEGPAQAEAAEVTKAVPRLAKSVGPVAVALGVALLGCLDFGGDLFRPPGLVLWVGGLTFCMKYLYISDGPRRLGEHVSALFAGRRVAISRKWLLLGLAMAVGALLRLQQLDGIPADIGWDLPYNFSDALAILRGEYHIFFPANLGREGMFFYLTALVARFAPLSHFSIKLTSALVGIATIPALYLAARRLFPESVALTATFLLAINRWHIVLSRSGFRVILLPLFSILLLYALVRALQTYRLFDFALAGLMLGLGLHTYFPFLFAFAALGAAFALLIFSGRRLPWRSSLALLALMLAVAVVVYGPLGRYGLEHWKEYVARAALQAKLLKGDENRTGLNLSFLMDNMRTTLLMFNVYGDGNSRFNVPGFRHFGLVSAVLLVLGLFYAVRRWRHGNNAVLLAFWFVFLLPSGLMALPRELPNIFRASGAIGPALILAALPLSAVGERLTQLAAALPEWDYRIRLKLSAAEDAYEFVWKMGRRALLRLVPVAAIALLLVVEYRDTRQFYFHDFVNVLPDRQNVSVAKEMARQIEDYKDLASAFIKVWPYWFDGRALLMYLRQESERPWNPYLYVDRLSPDQPPLSLITESALFLLNPEDSEGVNVLCGVFPRCVTKPYLFPDGTPAFIMVHVQR
jgi:4-amino-4-deoxy-L-arabinose transferase-like glycosyltransferase